MDSEKQKKILEMLSFIDAVCTTNKIWFTLSNGSAVGAIRENKILDWDEDADIYITIKDKEIFRNAVWEEIKASNKQYHLIQRDIDRDYPGVHDRLAYSVSEPGVFIDIWRLCGTPNEERKRNRFVRRCFFTVRIFAAKRKNLKTMKNHKAVAFFLKTVLLLIPEKGIQSLYNELEQKYNFDDSEYVYPISSPYGIRECLRKDMIEETFRHKFNHLYLPVPKRYDEYLTQIYGNYMIPQRTGYKPFIRKY
jgi:lipopolysaccharide cholinephosphotransferase